MGALRRGMPMHHDEAVETSSVSRRRRARATGFTVMEIVVVLAILGLMLAASLPAFLQWIQRQRILGVVNATASRMQMARQEAIKAQVPVVVQPSFANNDILIFANVDEDPNLQYDPDPAQPFKTVDYELARVRLPAQQRQVYFWAPTDATPEGADAIVGLTVTSAAQNAVVFLPDGTVRDTGAIRVADNRENYFEVRVEPRATARVQILKYYFNPPWGDPDGFFPRGRHPTDDVPMWKWY